MNAVAIASITFGVLLIATRGPAIFAPESTVQVFLGFLENTSGLRAAACLLGLAGIATLRGTSGAGTTLSIVIRFIAWWMVGAFGFLLFFPDFYQQLAGSVLLAIPAALLRVAGVFGVTIGALFVYFGAKAARAQSRS